MRSGAKLLVASVAAMGAALSWAPASAQNLRIGIQEDPDILDPAQGGSFVGRIVFGGLCDKLIDIAPDLKFVPQLATEWTWSGDARQLTLKLREGVLFHDGEVMDAQAVKANIDRYRSAPESKRKAELAPVRDVKVVDPRTVSLELSEPYAPLLGVLADRAGMMMSPKAIAELGDKIGTKPVCAGPFRFVERVPQDRIVLERFDRYWDKGSIFLGRVTYVPQPDNTVRLFNLQSGALDLIERVSATDAGTVRRDRRVKLVESTALGYNLISINLNNTDQAKNPLGQNEKVREALELSLDRKAINDVAFEGLFVPSNQPEAPGTRYYDPSHPVPARDVAKAKALLAEAGVPKPSFTLSFPNSPIDQQVAQLVQAMAAEAGFEIQLRALEAATLTANSSQGNYQATFTIWSGRPDPDGNISVWIGCTGFLNWGKYCDPKLDAVFAKARATTDEKERARLYHEAADIYLAARPEIFLYHFKWLWGLNQKVNGFTPYPDGIIRLQNVKNG
jgi:peptide/nickel transport system substrate-binding protein